MKRTFKLGAPVGLQIGSSYVVRLARNGYGKNYKHVVCKATEKGLQPKGGFTVNDQKIIGYYIEPLK